MNQSHSSNDAAQTAATPAVASSIAPDNAHAYQAPSIESIFSSDDLQREVLYAGGGPSIVDIDPPPFP